MSLLPFIIADNWELTVLGKGHVSISALSSFSVKIEAVLS